MVSILFELTQILVSGEKKKSKYKKLGNTHAHYSVKLNWF